jgi:hypothetical protein
VSGYNAIFGEPVCTANARAAGGRSGCGRAGDWAESASELSVWRLRQLRIKLTDTDGQPVQLICQAYIPSSEVQILLAAADSSGGQCRQRQALTAKRDRAHYSKG